MMMAPVQPNITATSITHLGDTDLIHYVSKFIVYMNSVGVTDVTQCRVFPLTLGDEAYRWYNTLPPSSVDSFHQMVQLFFDHFTTITPKLGTKQRLTNIWQFKDENTVPTLKELIS